MGGKRKWWRNWSYFKGSGVFIRFMPVQRFLSRPAENLLWPLIRLNVAFNLRAVNVPLLKGLADKGSQGLGHFFMAKGIGMGVLRPKVKGHWIWSGFKNRELINVKMVVLAPIPSPKESTATSVKPGLLRRVLRLNRRFLVMSSIMKLPP